MVDRMVERIRQGAEWLSVVLLFAVVAVTLAGVFMRYVVNRPLAWCDELGMILLLWAVFIADGFVTRDREHVAFDIVWDQVGETGRRWILILQGLFFGVLFAAALPTVTDYIMFLWRERTSSLEWRLDFVFFCFVFYLVALILRLFAKAWRAAGRNWRREVADSQAAQTSNIIG